MSACVAASAMPQSTLADFGIWSPIPAESLQPRLPEHASQFRAVVASGAEVDSAWKQGRVLLEEGLNVVLTRIGVQQGAPLRADFERVLIPRLWHRMRSLIKAKMRKTLRSHATSPGLGHGFDRIESSRPALPRMYVRIMRYWQPKLRVVRPGTWLQFDGSRRIAVIRAVNAGYPPRPLLRADTWAAGDVARDFIGYFPVDELRLCAEMVWSLYQAAVSIPPKDTTMNAKPPNASNWHPLLNADENRPGFWTLRDADGHAYGGIRITRQGADVYYLAQYRGNPIGRFDRLRTAVENVHLAHVRATQHPRAPFDPSSVPRP